MALLPFLAFGAHGECVAVAGKEAEGKQAMAYVSRLLKLSDSSSHVAMGDNPKNL